MDQKDENRAVELTLQEVEAIRRRLATYDPVFEKVSLEFLHSALRIINRNRRLFDRLAKY